MKPLTITCCFGLLLFIAACNDTANEETTTTKTDSPAVAAASTPTPPPALDSATIARNAQEYMTPSDIHKMMATWDGTWTGDLTFWMTPGAQPMKVQAKAVNKMVLGGLYQTSKHTGNMMGMPFEGNGTLAYDNQKKVFESVWIDNMGSGLMHLTGPWDEATKTITLKGKCIDPGTRQEIQIRETMKVVDDNTQLIEMYTTGPDGKEYKSMEINAKRSK